MILHDQLVTIAGYPMKSVYRRVIHCTGTSVEFVKMHRAAVAALSNHWSEYNEH